jgi:hypothetical protein
MRGPTPLTTNPKNGVLPMAKPKHPDVEYTEIKPDNERQEVKAAAKKPNKLAAGKFVAMLRGGKAKI